MKSPRKTRRPAIHRPRPAPEPVRVSTPALSMGSPFSTFGLIGIGWVLVFFASLMSQDCHPIVRFADEGPPHFRHLLFWMLLIGFTLMVRGFGRVPERQEADIPSRTAKILLAVVLAVAALLRLEHLGQPLGPYWYDWANSVIIGRRLIDNGEFHLMFPFGGREPFYFYVLGGLWRLMPDALGFVVQRFASALIDLTGLWILYLAGKELGSRRLGLLAAAMTAVSKPVVQLCVTGMRAGAVTFAVSLQVLTLLRLFRKPSLGNFLFWTFSTVLGMHTYSTFRTFILLVPFALLFWILADPEERRVSLSGAFLIFGGALFSVVAVFDNMFIAIHPGLGDLLADWRPLSARTTLVVLLFLMFIEVSVLRVLRARKTGKGRRLAYWSLSVNLMYLASYPLSRFHDFIERLPALSVFRSTAMEEQGWTFFLYKFNSMLRSLFYSAGERDDLRISNEPFYDLFSQGAIVLGLTWFLARPDWKKAFLLFLAFVGMAVRLLSADPTSTKLVSSAPALFLLSAWALSRLWSLAPPASWRRYGMIVFLAAFWVWGAWLQHQKIYRHWAALDSPDVLVSKEIGKEWRTHRVYVAPSDGFVDGNTQCVLNQGRLFYYLRTRTVIPLAPGEKLQDVVVLVKKDNLRIIRRLERDFPAAEWQPFSLKPLGTERPYHFMWKVRIPSFLVPYGGDSLLSRVELEGPWLCHFYIRGNGWGQRGVIFEHRLGSLSGEVPIDRIRPEQDIGEPQVVMISGTFEVPQGDEYEFSYLPENPLWLRVDDNTIVRTLKTGHEPFTSRLWLDKGSHPLELQVRLWNGPGLPKVMIRPNDDKAPWREL